MKRVTCASTMRANRLLPFKWFKPFADHVTFFDCGADTLKLSNVMQSTVLKEVGT